MKEDSFPQANAELACNPAVPPRILVVDDDPAMRRMNITYLTNSGYIVDAVEDGAAAWEALQQNSYDLLITDNNMPKVSGMKLVQKVRAARMTLPVIMATGAAPEHATISQNQLTAIVLKPYSVSELLGTVKNILRATLALVLLQLWLTPLLIAQDVKPAAESPIQSQDQTDQPVAVTISVHGSCEYSDDGFTFAPLKRAHILEQGAIIRTGETGRADVFFRRTGTTVRLQAGTEIKIARMAVTIKDGLPLVHTLLDLRAGRIFVVVRSEVAGSTLEISNADGRSVVEGSGIGKYIITADGRHVCANGSVLPLKVIGENGITVLSAGEQFSKKEGKMPAANPSVWVTDLIELDELQASTENVALEPAPLKP
jgi:DNA-binding response OmpR family regulator